MSMFGYKTVLQLGLMNSQNVELENFSYGFFQAIDDVGKPDGEVYAGSIQISFANLPTLEMLEWMMNSRKYKDGNIITYGEDESVLQKLTFTTGACVDMDISYSEMGTSYCLTTITVMAKKITVGETVVENGWQNV